jgi:hypothetical protein
MKPRPYFDNKHHVLPFDKIMELEKIDDRTFRSIVRAYSPTGGENGTYGGHVYAQAAWAAAQTVEAGFLIHVRKYCARSSLSNVDMFAEHHRLVYPRRSTNRTLRLHGPQNPGWLQLLHAICHCDSSSREGHYVHMYLFVQAR